MTTNEMACSREKSFLGSVPEDEPPRFVEAPACSRRTSLAWSAVFRAGRFFVFGLIGWLCLVSAANSVWRAVSFAAVLALAALIGLTWYLSRVRAERRWWAALDAYADKEQAKRPTSRRNGHARPQSQDR